MSCVVKNNPSYLVIGFFTFAFTSKNEIPHPIFVHLKLVAFHRNRSVLSFYKETILSHRIKKVKTHCLVLYMLLISTAFISRFKMSGLELHKNTCHNNMRHLFENSFVKYRSYFPLKKI